MSSFRSIRDKALDVDSDLRFMALEDFKKLLDKHNSQQIEDFVEILFKLLDDQNPDVRSQTTKVFPIILPFVSNSCIRNIIVQIFDRIKAQPGNLVSLMVLKLIFNSSFQFSLGLSRNVVELLLPQLTKPNIRSDFAEVLIDLIKNFSDQLKLEEFLRLASFLIQVSFEQISNSTGKKAVYALNLLLSSGKELENTLFDSLLTTVNSQYENYPKSFQYTRNQLELILTLVKNLQNLNLRLEPLIVEEIFNQAQVHLNYEPSDLDYDQIVEDNWIKEFSLDILIQLLDYDLNITYIVDKFIDYNPTSSDDDFDFEVDDDGVDFSDDEMENEIEDFDDGSWKLRLKAIIIISVSKDKNYLNNIIGKIEDKNEFIFKESLSALCTLLSSDSQALIPAIEQKIIANLNNENLLSFLSLIESIISKGLVFSDSFLQQFIRFLENNVKNLELIEVLSIVGLMIGSMSSELLDSLSPSLIPKLTDLLNKNSNIVFTDLKILNKLIIKLDPPKNTIIFDAIVDKLSDSKLLIDLKIEFFNSINIYILHNLLDEEKITKVVELYQQNLNSELLIKSNLVNLNDIYEKTLNPNFESFKAKEDFHSLLIGTLKMYLNVNTQNKSIYYLILQLFNKLDHSPETSELLSLGISQSKDAKILNLIFDNFSYVAFDPNSLADLIKLLNSIENPDIDSVNLTGLVRNLCKQGNFYNDLETSLDLKKPLNIKVLSMITLDLELKEKIESLQSRLNEFVLNKQFKEDFVRILQFLSFINLDYDLDRIELKSLIALLSLNDINDSTKFEVSKSLGYLTKSKPELLIEKFNNNDDLIKVQLLNSIKYFLKNYRNKEFEGKIWELLLDEVNISHTKKEFKLIGEILSIIAIKSDQYDEVLNILNLENQSIGLIYTNLIIVNNLIVNLENHPELIRQLMTLSLKFFDIVNIEVKIILVKNLINVYYHYPQLLKEDIDEILPRLFSELKPYEEFKKVIPMGPYKYVIDEGLEIRKLVFELLYSVINDDSIPKDTNSITRQIVEKGLSDKEFDVVNLSYTSLSKLLHSNPEYLNNFGNLEVLIDKLSNNLNKKLKAKATSQETEVYQESMKNLLNLLHKIHELLIKYNWSFNNWDVYYNAVKRIGDS